MHAVVHDKAQARISIELLLSYMTRFMALAHIMLARGTQTIFPFCLDGLACILMHFDGSSRLWSLSHAHTHTHTKCTKGSLLQGSSRAARCRRHRLPPAETAAGRLPLWELAFIYLACVTSDSESRRRRERRLMADVDRRGPIPKAPTLALP